jgi:hypothetical protein
MLLGMQLQSIKREFHKYINTPIDEEIDYVVYIVSTRCPMEMNYKE